MQGTPDPARDPAPDPVPALPAEPVVIRGDGLVLREWAEDDLPAMAELFDDPAVAHRTPLAWPFDAAAARAYLDRARSTRADGVRLHLAVTEDGDAPLGEVLLGALGTERPAGAVTLGYAIGGAHRGRRLGPVRRIFAGPRRLARTLAARPHHPSTSSTRAIRAHAESTHQTPRSDPRRSAGQALAPRATRLLTAYAHTVLGVTRVRLQIEADNAASVAVARAAGYRLLAELPPVAGEQKGRKYLLQTWEHTATD